MDGNDDDEGSGSTTSKLSSISLVLPVVTFKEGHLPLPLLLLLLPPAAACLPPDVGMTSFSVTLEDFGGSALDLRAISGTNARHTGEIVRTSISNDIQQQ